MQLTIDIPDEQAAELIRLSGERDNVRNQLVQKALAAYLPMQSAPDMSTYTAKPEITDPAESRRLLDEAFGIWKELDIDSVEYIRGLRSEWVRDWDVERS